MHRLDRRKRKHDTRLVALVRDEAERLRSASDERLREAADETRALAVANGCGSSEVMVRAFGLVTEAMRRKLGVELYDVQLLASAPLARGGVVEMQTGEGKTLACAPAAFLRALTGRGVHVVTPNSYLARRDSELLAPVFASLGVQVGLLPEGACSAAKHESYRCDITYGTGYEFGFDYLRDQLLLRQRANQKLGKRLLDQVRGRKMADPTTVQRGLAYAIVDEIDNVLLDDASSPLILCGEAQGEAKDAAAHREARSLLKVLASQEHYRIEASSETVKLTPAGIERIHAADIAVPVRHLRRTWGEYVEQMLRAEFLMSRDAHYVVTNDTVQIVDPSTGRIFADRTWRDGLHQAIEAKESVPITAERQASAQITRQRFFRLYRGLSGMTGTATGCEREFRHVYRLGVVSIPLRVPCRRMLLPTRVFATGKAKWMAVADAAQQVLSAGRAVLVGTRSIADSERLAAILAQRGVAYQLLNGRQDAEEAAIVAQAGQPGTLTIATNLAGRGTDIRLRPGVAERGGLHVILAECHESERIDRQFIGRCARQGDPGSAQIFVSAEDSLIQRFGPWLTRSMRRCGDAMDEVPVDLSGPLRRLQKAAERAQYAARCALLRHDLTRDSLLSPDAVEV